MTSLPLVRQRLLDWFATHGRDLPWRREHAPWPVLVSEFMLQQTQMNRVKKAAARSIWVCWSMTSDRSTGQGA